ncbi:MAG: peptidoglycan DD-metalloendopeptidase family protein [Patescibacteria group bacterium]
MTTKNSRIIYFALSFFILIFAFSILPVRADEIEDKIAELREKIEELTKQAEMYRGNVLEKQKEADTLKRQIDILNNQIKRLETEIDITENRILSSEMEIGDLQEKIFDAQHDIEFTRATIGQMMTDLDERDRLNMLATIIKNPNLSGFTNEAQRAETLNGRLNQLLVQIKDQKIQLEERKKSVEQKKVELEKLNDRQVNQRASLSGTKSSKNRLLVDTKGQESKYQQLLSSVEKQKAAFFAELQGMENSAIANGTVIVHVKATAVPPRGTKIFQEPYHDKFYTTQGYGMTSYAKRGAYGGAIHNGRDVASGCSSAIYAIGNGVVLASGYNAGFGNWIAIRHDAGGGMVSVYAHMVRGTTLSNGKLVTTETVLGYEGTTGTSTGCHLHLSLYREFFTYINTKNDQLYFNYANGSLNPVDYIK